METSSYSDSNGVRVPQRPLGTRKPLSIVLEEERDASSTSTHRHLSLIDLVSVGVGGTIGSGIFVLAGLIAHNYAGPSTFVSFILSGLAASCSGLCFADFSSRLPSAGSTYVYAFVSLGEWAAVVAGACLTLEYGVSGAAVARSWGDKVHEWMVTELNWDSAGVYFGGGCFNPFAGLISALSVLILSLGVQESKTVTNVFTLLKVLLVIFMIVVGLSCFRASNLQTFSPYGVTGILRGATSSFFGYLGFDEVCCLASEAKNPIDIPRAVLWTLGIVTILYVMASIALVGMLPYEDISEVSGFPAAFASRGIPWAANLTAVGEVITLPVVVLISLLAQPRLFAAMARDGLLPEIFCRKDDKGNLFWSNILCGVPMTVLAAVVPFSWLDDAISVGILIAFNLTNSSLILMECELENNRKLSLGRMLLLFHIVAFFTGMTSSDSLQWVQIGFLVVTISFAFFIHFHFPPTGCFGDPLLRRHDSNVDWQLFDNDNSTFQTPFMPLLPLLGISMNWYLITQLEWKGMLLLVMYLLLVSAFYLASGRSRQVSNYRYDRIHDVEGPVLLREFSLPIR